MDSEIYHTGTGAFVLRRDKYGSLGTGPITLYYKTGSTVADCDDADWTLYDDVSIISVGYVKIRTLRS